MTLKAWTFCCVSLAQWLVADLIILMLTWTVKHSQWLHSNIKVSFVVRKEYWICVKRVCLESKFGNKSYFLKPLFKMFRALWVDIARGDQDKLVRISEQVCFLLWMQLLNLFVNLLFYCWDSWIFEKKQNVTPNTLIQYVLWLKKERGALNIFWRNLIFLIYDR